MLLQFVGMYVSMFRTDTHTVTVICMYTQTVHALRNTQYHTVHKVYIACYLIV